MFYGGQLDRIEKKLDRLLAIWDEKPELELEQEKEPEKRRESILPLILEVMGDGRIWATSAIAEELSNRGHTIDKDRVSQSLSQAIRSGNGKILRPNKGAYRLLKEAEAA